MAIELEYKLQIPSEETMNRLLSAPEITALRESDYREIPMKTTYYDTGSLLFSDMGWTLRHRMEGDESVVCFKCPGDVPHSRNEWQVSAPELNLESVLGLLAQGAPMEIAMFFRGENPPQPICGAEFLRRCAMVTFSDGSRAEIAIDKGRVFGTKGELPISELELELYEGEPDEMKKFAVLLCNTYDLEPQPLSKFARAKTLR